MDFAPVENIWLMREGGENETGDAVVYVQIGGVWYEAIREILSGSFSHCISSHGLMDTSYCKPASWFNGIESDSKTTAPTERST